ncbi:hypothetical protein [Paenarthrobacter sp. NPDC018779]|uniref:hypothetical protein n=1 Tax=Paenarthrobacter sp. NPDC018779 TaxID=3364375 RepID=UPI0037CA78B3
MKSPRTPPTPAAHSHTPTHKANHPPSYIPLAGDQPREPVLRDEAAVSPLRGVEILLVGRLPAP